MRRLVRVSLVVGRPSRLNQPRGFCRRPARARGSPRSGERSRCHSGGCRSTQPRDHGVALADDDSTVGLLGDAASLEADGRAAQVHRDGGGVEFNAFMNSPGPRASWLPRSRALARISSDRSMKPFRRILNQEGGGLPAEVAAEGEQVISAGFRITRWRRLQACWAGDTKTGGAETRRSLSSPA